MTVPSAPHAQTAAALAAALATDVERGLSMAAVAERRAEFGPNALPAEKKPSVLLLFLKQFHRGLTYVLFAAAAISILAGERNDAIGILVAVLINAVFGFAQERRAEQAVEKLRQMVVQEATVLREGQRHRVPAADVTVGDVLLLSEGDRVSADGRIVEARDFRTDESPLTGESLPASKRAEPVDAAAPVADQKCMAWMGTTVISGGAKIVVTRVGASTAFGAIAASLAAIKRGKSPLESQLDTLGRQLGVAAVVVSGLAFALGLYHGFPVFEMFFFAVALMVSVVPEGLPAVMAVVMAIGVQRMARRNAIVRHVPSVETLGAASIICTDKTGTLTENKMTVRRVVVAERAFSVTGEGWSTAGEFRVDERRAMPVESPDAALLLRAAASCAEATIEVRADHPVAVGDPTEAALVIAAAKAGIDKDELGQEYVQLDQVPFNSVRKFRAVLVEHLNGDGERERQIFAVGAYEVLLGRCDDALLGGEPVPFDDSLRGRYDAANDDMASRAMRVLGVAVKNVGPTHGALTEEDVAGMAFAGMVGMTDPPRAGVAEAVARCHRAGIRVMMLTGDQKATALAIAREIGILAPDADPKQSVFAEADLVGLKDPEFEKVVTRAAVFARVSPDTKLRVVRTLRERGHVVAMTGDGVNDAPALKQASIGVAMGVSGTDVTREVADLVLTDDNFVTITNAVEEGRIVFRNITQTTAYLFMTNVGEVVTVLVSLACKLPLPLLPAQILWMNLVTDTFPSIALATEPSTAGLLNVPPRDRGKFILTRSAVLLTALTSAVMCVGTLALFMWALGNGELPYARSMAFTAMAVFQLWNVFSLRSATVSVFRMGFFSNPYLLWAVVISFGMQIAVLYVPTLQGVFGTVPLSSADLLLVVAVTSPVFFVVEAYKVLCRRGVIPQRWL